MTSSRRSIVLSITFNWLESAVWSFNGIIETVSYSTAPAWVQVTAAVLVVAIGVGGLAYTWNGLPSTPLADLSRELARNPSPEQQVAPATLVRLKIITQAEAPNT